VPLNTAAADPQGQGAALYCVHSIAGAGGTDFLALAKHLDGTVRMFGIQAPPKRMEEPDFGSSVAELGELYAEAICEAQPAGAVVIAGWSAGAPIALEIAHRLRARGREIAFLVAIDGAPEIPSGLRPWDPRYWLRVAANLPAWFFDSRAMDPGFPMSTVTRLAKSYVSRARSLLRLRKPEVAPRLEGFISLDRYPAAQRQFMSRLYDAIMRYRPAVWDGPVTVYEARVGPAMALPQHLERWRTVAPRAERALLEGNHVTIMREPRVAELARDLERRIRDAAAQSAAG
jgi:thioesterase domain-containing protein